MKPKYAKVASKPRIAPAKRKSTDVDTSDIAPLTDEFFAKAVRNPLYKPIKRSTTLRIDADILAWLRGQGAGYQTRINAILRRAMLEDASKR